MAKRSRTEYSILNILTGVVGYALNNLIAYVCRMVFVRCLSQDYLGLSSLMSNILNVLSLAELGIGSAIVYELYKPIAVDDKEKITSFMQLYKKIYCIIGIVVAAFGLTTLPFLTTIIGDTSGIKENIYLIYILYLFNTVSGYFFSYRSALVNAQQKNYIVSGLSYIVSIAQSIVQIVILLCSENYLLYLVIMCVGSMTYNILINVYTKKQYPYIDNKNSKKITPVEKKRLLKNVRALVVYKLSGVLVNNTDNIVINLFSGLATTGLTSNYSLLSNTLSSIVTQVFSSITGSIGNLNASENTKQQYKFFKALNLANFWIFGWAAIGIAFVSSDLVQLCFGEEYVMSVNIPIILAINVYIVGMQNAVWAYKNTKGMFKYGQYLLLLTAALNVAGDIVLGQLLGVFGIFLASAIARLLTNAWYEPYAVYKIAFQKNPIIYFRKYFIYILILVISGGCCYFLCKLCKFNLAINIILKIIICSVVPNLIFYFVFRRYEEFSYIRDIINRVKGIFLKFFHKKSN